MIALRSFVCIDDEPPTVGPFLVLATGPGASVTFYGPTRKDARAKAEAWATEQRTKAKPKGSRSSPAKAPPARSPAKKKAKP